MADFAKIHNNQDFEILPFLLNNQPVYAGDYEEEEEMSNKQIAYHLRAIADLLEGNETTTATEVAAPKGPKARVSDWGKHGDYDYPVKDLDPLSPEEVGKLVIAKLKRDPKNGFWKNPEAVLAYLRDKGKLVEEEHE